MVHPMTTLGSTPLHLCIADFKFMHNFIICNQLPNTELIFGIDIQKKFSLSYAWDKDKQCFIQQNGKFLAFTHADTWKAAIGTVKSTLKIPPKHNGVVPIKISGPLLTTHTAHFVTDDNTPKDLVIDYRTLNKVTRKFMWPMPKVEDIFSKLNGATYFTTLDLCAGYHHIPLDKSSIPKTAFNLSFSKYKYVKVLFRLTQAPAYFQELMTSILKDFPFAIAYLDDIIIFSKTPQEHLSHIQMVFEKLKSANLSMKKSKCSFFSKEIQYLGHILSDTGI